MQLSRQQAAEAYAHFRALPLSAWRTASAEQMGALMAGADQGPIALNEEQFRTGFHLLGRIAHGHDEETFIDAALHGEMPVIKMSAQEMELAKGGLAIVTCILIGCLAGAVLGGAWGLML